MLTVLSSEMHGDQMVQTEQSTFNYFTPEVFRRVIALHPTLEIINMYFMDRNGLRLPGEELGEFQTAAAIIQKRA